ncbi:MAG: pyridoxal-phosphate dependent enzyme, partial [Chloroflexi bacterium]
MSDRQPDSITLEDVEEARKRLDGIVTRTPLVWLDDGGTGELYLKLENLQPIRSFKIRGAANAIAMLAPEELDAGVYTASAGNMAQGVAWNARRLGLRCSVVVPDGAPRSKLAAIQRLGARIV